MFFFPTLFVLVPPTSAGGVFVMAGTIFNNEMERAAGGTEVFLESNTGNLMAMTNVITYGS